MDLVIGQACDQVEESIGLRKLRDKLFHVMKHDLQVLLPGQRFLAFGLFGGGHSLTLAGNCLLHNLDHQIKVDIRPTSKCQPTK